MGGGICTFIVFVGTPLIIVNTTYLQMCWIPLFGFVYLKAFKRRSIINVFTILAGVIFGMFLLMELSQGAVLGVMLMGLLYLTAAYTLVIYEKRISSIKRITMLFLTIGIIGIGLGAVNLFPILAQQEDMYRYTAEGFVRLKDKLPLEEFYRHPVTFDGLRELLGAKSGVSWFGIITVLLSMAGLFTKGKYTINAPGYICLQFGKILYICIILASISCYFPEMIFHIPFVNMLRETYLYAGLLPFATIILSAYGSYSIYCWMAEEKTLADSFYNPYFMIMAIFLLILQYGLANYNFKFIWVLVGAFIVFLVMYRFKQNKKIICISIILLGVLNIWHINQVLPLYHKWTFKEAKEQYDKVQESYKRLYTSLEAWADGIQMYRVMTWGGEKGTISDDSMVNIGGYYVQGYWEPIYRKTIDSHLMLDLEKRLILNNVLFFIHSEDEPEEYYIAYKEFLDKNFEYVGNVENVYPSYDSEEGQTLRVYKNKNYIGNAWITYDYVQCNEDISMDEQMSILNDSEFLIQDKTLVEVRDKETEDFLKVISQSDDRASVFLERYTNNSIELRCISKCDGIMATAESDAPGWKAYVDGKKQAIITVNYGKKGLLLEKGEHTIKFVYCPNSYIVGAIITIGTSIIVLTSLIILFLNPKFKLLKREESRDEHVEEKQI